MLEEFAADVDDVEDRAWLVGGGWDEQGEKVEARALNEGAGWSMVAVWGFMEVGEGRRYVRKMVMRNKAGKVVRDMLVYDYVGLVDA